MFSKQIVFLKADLQWALVTLGVLWWPHRAEAPEVPAQWRANWFSYWINRSVRQIQAKLMVSVFSLAFLGTFAWHCHLDTGAPAKEHRKIPKHCSSYTAMTLMRMFAKVNVCPYTTIILQTAQIHQDTKTWNQKPGILIWTQTFLKQSQL